MFTTDCLDDNVLFHHIFFLFQITLENCGVCLKWIRDVVYRSQKLKYCHQNTCVSLRSFKHSHFHLCKNTFQAVFVFVTVLNAVCFLIDTLLFVLQPPTIELQNTCIVSSSEFMIQTKRVPMLLLLLEMGINTNTGTHSSNQLNNLNKAQAL